MSNKGSDNNVGSIEKISQTSDKNVANIEEDVKRCNELTKVEHANWIGISNQLAISHILAEREQDKKRIQELEEKLLDMIQGTEIINKETPEYVKENYIPKQAVIDKMEELNKEIKNSDEIDAIFKIKQQQVLQELLEGGRK